MIGCPLFCYVESVIKDRASYGLELIGFYSVIIIEVKRDILLNSLFTIIVARSWQVDLHVLS